MKKNYFWKQIISSMLSVILVFSLGLSCYGSGNTPISAKTASSKPSTWLSDKMIEVTAAGAYDLKVDYKEIIVWQEWQERLGVKFEMSFYNTEDWKTQLNLMLASNDIPDFIHNSTLNSAEMANIGSQGYFADFLEYEDLLVNMKQAWEDHPGLQGAMTSYDGGIYGTKFVNTSVTNKICRSFINQTWLNNVGMEKPTTIDELYDVLKAFKEQDANKNGDLNDEIPLGFYSSVTSATEVSILAAYGIITNTSKYILQADGDDVYLANASEAYKEYLTFMSKLHDEGLIDDECFTLTAQEVMLNCQNDKYGVYATGSAPYVMATASMDYDKNWPGLMGLTSEFNEVPTLGIPNGISSGFIMSVSSDSRYVKELVQFVDYLFGDEGGLSTFSGYEGLTFDYVYDDLLNIDVLTLYSPEGYASADEFRQYKAIFNGPFSTFQGVPVRNAIWYDAPLDVLQQDEVLEKYGWIAQLSIAARDENLVHVPTFPYEAMSYTEDETDVRTSLVTDITSYLDNAKANFILGTWDIDKDWERYLSELDKIGLERLLEIETASWMRYNTGR